MAANSGNNTIELAEENFMSISGIGYDTITTASLLPFIATKHGSVEGMQYYKLPELPYKISHLANSAEYKLERHKDKKVINLKNIPTHKIKDLINEFFTKELHDKTTKLFLDDKFNPILGGTGSDISFLGVANLNDLKTMDLFLLRDILLEKVVINEYAILTEESKLFHLAEASARMNLIPYFYAHIEELYPGILVDYKSEDAVKFNDEGVKLFLEFWVKNLGLDTAHFNLSIPEDDLLAFSSDKLEMTRLSKETSSKISSNSFLDFAEKKKLLYVHEEKSNGEEEYDEDGSVINFKGYPTDVLTSLKLSKNISTWAKASWTCFINNYGLFDTGCDIIFAPQQVVLFPDGKLAFSGDEIIKMKYLGKDHRVAACRNSIRIINTSDVDNYFYSRISKLFAIHPDIALNVRDEEENES